MDFDQSREMVIVRRRPYRVTLEADGVIRIGSGIRESALPQAIGIEWLFPHAMIAFVDGSTQWNANLLQGADVLAQIHQQRGIGGKFFEPLSELAIEGNAALHIYIGLLIANGINAPNRGIACRPKRQDH